MMRIISSKKTWLILLFILGCMVWEPVKAEQTDGVGDSAGIEAPLPEMPVVPSEKPVPDEVPAPTNAPWSPTPVPTASPAPLVLKNKNAAYRAGKQKGIGYGKIKKGKI